VGGPLALVRNGDMIRINAAARTISIDLSTQELETRRELWRPPEYAHLGGLLEKYAAVVGPANLGAVTHSGNVVWPHEG
jgi:dihydroxy-acid dehydratase